MSIKDGLSKIVGDKDFSDAPEKLSAYARDNSLSKAYPPSYVVQPESAAEVQQIVQLANENKIPLIPVSSGVHFYGNTLPVHSGIIMDLRKMNKILAIDERSRMARFEPGVTWGQLHAELAKHDLMATIPLLPHAQKSALTSLLEREPGLTPKFEYTDPIITMEVVLPEGELFKTGSACVPGFPDKSYSQGVNPSGPGDFIWSRLFQGAQGTLGIATWIQCKVEYRSKVNKTFFVPFDSLESATRFVYKVQRRVVGEECLILNDLELAAITAGLFSQDFDALKKKFAPWTVLLVLGGGKRFPADKIEYEEEAVRDVAAELSLTNLPAI
ncbi:MAG TPA: FAD-binding oxidoreductase, partial [Dehalococcoidia bacterium]|nr:FAD-binding oxidoreductase [Dehalococcoidia bacterium]